MIDWLIDIIWLIDWLIDWYYLADWLIDWLIDIIWLIDWLIDWSIHWNAKESPKFPGTEIVILSYLTYLKHLSVFSLKKIRLNEFIHLSGEWCIVISRLGPLGIVAALNAAQCIPIFYSSSPHIILQLSQVSKLTCFFHQKQHCSLQSSNQTTPPISVLFVPVHAAHVASRADKPGSSTTSLYFQVPQPPIAHWSVFNPPHSKNKFVSLSFSCKVFRLIGKLFSKHEGRFLGCSVLSGRRGGGIRPPRPACPQWQV